MCLVRAEDVCKSYWTAGRRNPVLKHVSLQVELGEMVAVVGSSGSGKTTLLHGLSGIDALDAGSVQFQGMELSGMSEDGLSVLRREHFGMVFQDFQLLESLDVRENILLPLILGKKGEGTQKGRLMEIAAAVGIDGLLDKGIMEISGGQKQRVAIARAFIHNPKLVFADEPTGNLDRDSTRNVMRCIRKVQKNCHTGVLLVTHDSYVASCCDRALLLQDGEVAKEVSKGEPGFEDQIVCMMQLAGGWEDEDV